jgi:hypothetical protein
MQIKEESRNKAVRKRNHRDKHDRNDESFSDVWKQGIKAGRKITGEGKKWREKVVEYKDFVEQVKEQI